MQRMSRWVAGVAVAMAAIQAHGQTYPTRPIKFILGSAAGGGTDISARIIGAALEKRIGQPVIVEHRTGAGGLIAANAVINAEPDGYTVLYAEPASTHPVLTKNGIEANKVLQPVSNLQSGGFFVVVPAEHPARSWQELVAFAKANPGKVNFGSVGNTTDLMVAVLKARTGIDAVTVRYKGDAPAITAMLGREVDFVANNISGVASFIQAGKLRPLFTTLRTPSSLMPQVPTAEKAGIKDYVVEFNLGLWAPRATPQSVVQKLAAEAAAAAKSTEVGEQFRKLGGEPIGSTPEEQLKTYEASVRFWSEAAKIAKYEPQ
jgi:tripartite-type tricarboxylate transporter receptor subunit TctC